MDNWRRQKWDNHGQEPPRRKSPQYKKPPRGSWQPRVPSWEKEFCKVIGSLDWETFLHMKKFIHLYNNVLEWDDSAGEEAFHDAKKRFWAKKHGLACDNASLPDPDLYIDEINWSSEIDPEILLELECKHEVPNAGESHETVVIFGDSFLANQAFLSTGWGDNEENFKIPPTNESPSKSGNLGEHGCDGTANICTDFRYNKWHINDGSGAIRHVTSEDGWNNTGVGIIPMVIRISKTRNQTMFKDHGTSTIWGESVMLDDTFQDTELQDFKAFEHHKNHLWWKDRG